MGLPGQLPSGTRKQSKTDRCLGTLSTDCKSSQPQAQEAGQGKQERGMAELGSSAQAVGQEESAQAIKAGTSVLGRVQGRWSGCVGMK